MAVLAWKAAALLEHRAAHVQSFRKSIDRNVVPTLLRLILPCRNTF